VSEPTSFQELIRRVRAGDQGAAAELVQRYEPTIRRVVRFRLTDTRLRTHFDSMDICQSVMASFFVRTAAGDYELDQPEQLLNLLAAMARNKLAEQVRKQTAERRDHRRVGPAGKGQEEFLAREGSPSQQVSAEELLREVQRRLSPDERRLMELRNQGLEWSEIAGRLGGNAEALRKQLSRALDRITCELGIEPGDE
jgi:RNA polymerase sigma-70 factor (ECF subfamily)